MIRAAAVADVPHIHAMIGELAEYVRALEHARASQEQVREALFGAHPAAFALIAEDGGAVDAPVGTAAEPVGFALWFRNFSAWTGTHGVHLEDLYVRPPARGRGHGRALLTELARICVERGYERFEWSVLDWNAPAIGFYESLGAVPVGGCTTYRLHGAPLRELAAPPSRNGAASVVNLLSPEQTEAC